MLTDLKQRLGYIVTASNPKNILEAQSPIRLGLQVSYFENQMYNSQNPIHPSQISQCSLSGKSVHKSVQFRPTIVEKNSNSHFNAPIQPNFNSFITPLQSTNQFPNNNKLISNKDLIFNKDQTSNKHPKRI